jgi:hypothetical protein
MCRFWREDTPVAASMTAYEHNLGRCDGTVPSALWLPDGLRGMTMADLRRLLDGKVVRVDGDRHQLQGQRLVWLDARAVTGSRA